MQDSTKITFFEFLTPLILSGKKTITIRDASEKHYRPNTEVEVFTLESNQKVCDIKVLSVESLNFCDINEFHAKQESMSLDSLKELIKKIYPNTDELYLISFELIQR